MTGREGDPAVGNENAIQDHKLNVLAILTLDVDRAYQENIRLYGEARAREMNDVSRRAVGLLAKLLAGARRATCQCPRASLKMHQHDCHLVSLPKLLEQFEGTT